MLPPGDSALRARLLARLAAALQPSPTSAEPVAVAREAIAIARRLGDDAALLDTLYAAVAALMDIVGVDRDARAQPRGRAAGAGRRTIASACCARTFVWRSATWASARSRRATRASPRSRRWPPSCGRPGTAGGRGMLRAVRATMEGRFADAERLAAAARDAGRAAGHEAADRIWITNREAQLRAADRHEEMLAWEPEARRSRAVVHIAAAWQAMGSALMYARLEQRGRGAPARRAAAGVVSHAGRQPVRAVLRRRGGRDRRACASWRGRSTSASSPLATAA